jgi:hypothetical protein
MLPPLPKRFDFCSVFAPNGIQSAFNYVSVRRLTQEKSLHIRCNRSLHCDRRRYSAVYAKALDSFAESEMSLLSKRFEICICGVRPASIRDCDGRLIT